MVFIALYIMICAVCLLTQNGKKRIPRLIACSCIFIGMQLLLGLRHIEYGGVDTQVYARDFTTIIRNNYSLADIFKYFYKDYGFYLFARLFSLFCTNMNTWIFACAIPYTLSVTWLIYKYSKNIFLSFIMFISFAYYLYNFQLMRHVFALGICILAYHFLINNEIKKFLITVLIASFFHAIAIIFIGAYFIRKGTTSTKQLLWIIGGGIIVLLLSQDSVYTLLFRMIPFLGSRRYFHYSKEAGGFSTQFLYQLIFILLSWIILNYKKINKSLIELSNTSKNSHARYLRCRMIIMDYTYRMSDPNIVLLYNMAIIALIFYLMTFVLAESYRMAQFYSIFTIILVPDVLSLVKNRNLRLIICLVIFLLGIRYFFGGLYGPGSIYNPYVFFWESTQSLF